jgi:hypothetical protein
MVDVIKMLSASILMEVSGVCVMQGFQGMATLVRILMNVLMTRLSVPMGHA